MDVRVGLWRKLSAEELMLLNCSVGEDSWESLGLQGDPTSPFWRRSAWDFLGRNDAEAEAPVLWPPHSRVDSLEKTLMLRGALRAGGEGDNRGWDGWMALLTWWTLSLSELQELVMDSEAWRAAIRGVIKSRTRLSNWTELNFCQGQQEHTMGKQ